MSSTALWTPSDAWIAESNLAHYMKWIKERLNLEFRDYQSLWEWSTNDSHAFWKSIWDYFNILHDGSYDHVLSNDPMPHTRWFEGTRLNYAEHIFRNYDNTRPALLFQSETKSLEIISWSKLKRDVTALQSTLRRLGVESGDVVAAFVPSVPEATIGFLAANSLGAIWTSCSPDFGVQSVVDRFAQTNPKVLLVCGGYAYGGKYFDKQDEVIQITNQLPQLKAVIHIDDSTTSTSDGYIHLSWKEAIAFAKDDLIFHRVPFQDPIWVLYSSGTTGLPKAITHSQGGILLEHLKYLTFHNNVKPDDRCFWYTTTGWMMWNYIQSSLLCGATLVLYDGSPGFPHREVLWKLADEAGIHHFGTSAGFIMSNRKAGMSPKTSFNLSSLQSLSSTGSTLPPEGFEWVYQEVKHNLWLASMSGGTDVCSAFVGGNPIWPVHTGEIQCRALGCRMEAYNESGHPVVDEVGEMVITKPMPSMPVYFWNDPEFKRYTESYFEMFPSVWRHGDWITITKHQGVVIYGRSDATLNRGGVRIGTSEIYRAMDKIDAVADSLIVCIEKDKGEFFMPLFVQLKPGKELNEDLKRQINRTLRQDYSPRHVPDTIVATPDIPYTLSGKKTETPIKKILMGKTIAEVSSSGSLRNPTSLDFFITYFNNSLKP